MTPNFYPVIYLKKIGQNKQATSFSSFTFPNFQSNDFALGQNPFTTINQTRFVFNFTGATTDPWTYYTMVIYQNTWGLTDQKKSEFSIRINADDVDFLIFDEAQEYFEKGLYDFIEKVNAKLEKPKLLVLYDPDQAIVSNLNELEWYTDFFIEMGYSHFYFDENYRCIQNKSIAEVSNYVLFNEYGKIKHKFDSNE